MPGPENQQGLVVNKVPDWRGTTSTMISAAGPPGASPGRSLTQRRSITTTDRETKRQKIKAQDAPEPPNPSTTEPQPFRLLSLPGEMRQLIYDFTLVERPKWDKPHRVTCVYHPVHHGYTISPPFKYRRDQCPCALRRGLNLLLACHQVHAEAAPRFWGGNAHCFRSLSEFVEDIGSPRRLRPEYRALLRHVRIMSNALVQPANYRSQALAREPIDADMQTGARAWRALLACSGLRVLEMHPNLARWCPACLRACPWAMPRLQTLRLIQVRMLFLPVPSGTQMPLTVWDPQLGECLQSKAIHVGYGAELDLERLRSALLDDRQVDDMVEEAITTMKWMRRTLHRQGIVGTCRGRDPPTGQIVWSYPFPLREDLDEPAQEITLRYQGDELGRRFDAIAKLALYGLAVSKTTVARLRQSDEFKSGQWGVYGRPPQLPPYLLLR